MTDEQREEVEELAELATFAYERANTIKNSLATLARIVLDLDSEVRALASEVEHLRRVTGQDDD